MFAKKFFCDLADNHYRQYLHGGGDGSNHHWLKPKYFARLAMAYWRMVLGYAMVRYPEDVEAHGYGGCFEVGMTLCVEAYIGAVGGHDGVKLEEQVLITDSGAVPLSTYRYEAAFLD